MSEKVPAKVGYIILASIMFWATVAFGLGCLWGRRHAARTAPTDQAVTRPDVASLAVLAVTDAHLRVIESNQASTIGLLKEVARNQLLTSGAVEVLLRGEVRRRQAADANLVLTNMIDGYQVPPATNVLPGWTRTNRDIIGDPDEWRPTPEDEKKKFKLMRKDAQARQ